MRKKTKAPRYDLGGFFKDMGKLWLGTVAAPAEALTGKQFANFEYDTELGKKLGAIEDPYNKVLGGLHAAVGTAGLNMVLPGSGTTLKSAAGAIGNQIPNQDMTATKKSRSGANFNPYGVMRNGGEMKQYNAPTHEEGGQLLDANRNPTNDPSKAIAEIEKQETSWRNYVFSDTLGENGKTFAQMSKRIANKYKGKTDDLSLSTMEMEMKKLMEKNETLRQTMEQVPGKYDIGGPLFDFSNINTGDLGYEINDPNAPNPFAAQNVFAPQTLPVIEGSDLPNVPIGTNESKKSLFLGPFDMAAVGLKGLAFGKSVYDALQPSEQEQLQLNREANAAKNLAAGRNINMAAILNEAMYNRNAAMLNNQNARSANVNRALDMQSMAAANRDTIRAKLEEQSMNNAYRMEEANLRGMLGAQDAAERVRRQNVQSQNDAVRREFGRQVFADMSNIGTQLNKAQIYQDMYKNKRDLFTQQFREAVALTNNMGGDYRLFGENAEAILEKLVNNKPLSQEELNMAIQMLKK